MHCPLCSIFVWTLKLTHTRVMAKSEQLSLETRQFGVVLRSEGYFMRAIAEKLRISLHRVHHYLTRKANTGSNMDRKRCGRPKIISPAKDKHIRVCSLRNRYLTCPEVTADLNNTHEMPVSSTVPRRLKSLGLMGRVSCNKPFLKTKIRNEKIGQGLRSTNSRPMSRERKFCGQMSQNLKFLAVRDGYL